MPANRGPDNVDDVDARARSEAEKRSLLADIERALLEAISDSREVQAGLRRLRRAGWLLELQLGCRRDTPVEPAPEPAAPAARHPAAGRRRAAAPSGSAAPSAEAPAFRMDAGDLRFLRSIGIDPTRRRPARRPS